MAAFRLGADFGIVGRAYLYGPMAEEVRKGMVLMGTRTTEDLKISDQVIAPELKNADENIDA